MWRQTAFTYDGLSRRTSIASTPTGGGGTVTLNYIWCGERICQARNAGNLVTRSYYDEGEFVTGGPAQPYYYGVDQLGSVRRAFASTTSAPAFGYDPYGNALQAAALPTDFGYAGMFFNAESGLYLTQYRAYDPVAGRWLSRDPLGEESDPAANLYRYVSGDPVGFIDPQGLQRGIPWGRSSPINPYARVQGPYNFTPYQPATLPGSTPPNIRTNVCRPGFEDNLRASGYTQSVTNVGSSYPRYELGEKSYQFYRSSAGEPSVFFNPGYGPGLKIRIPE